MNYSTSFVLVHESKTDQTIYNHKKASAVRHISLEHHINVVVFNIRDSERKRLKNDIFNIRFLRDGGIVHPHPSPPWRRSPLVKEESNMYQWRKFEFFEEKYGGKSTIPEEVTGKITCCSSGRGKVVIGCDDGAVSLLDRGIKFNFGFQAHSSSVLYLQQLQVQVSSYKCFFLIIVYIFFKGFGVLVECWSLIVYKLLLLYIILDYTQIVLVMHDAWNWWIFCFLRTAKELSGDCWRRWTNVTTTIGYLSQGFWYR